MGLFDDLMGAVNDLKEVSRDIMQEVDGVKRDVVDSVSDIRTGARETTRDIKTGVKSKVRGAVSLDGMVKSNRKESPTNRIAVNRQDSQNDGS